MFIYIITIYAHNKPIKYNQRYNQSYFKINTENYDLDEVGSKAGFNIICIWSLLLSCVCAHAL